MASMQRFIFVSIFSFLALAVLRSLAPPTVSDHVLEELSQTRHNLTLPEYLERCDAGTSTRQRTERRWHGDPPAPADDATWERYKCKGRKLVYQMSLTNKDVGSLMDPPQTTVQSPYDFNTLEQWGYEIGKSTAMYRDLSDGGMWGVGTFFGAIGISSKLVEKEGHWDGLRISHYHMTDSPFSQTEPQEQLGYQDPDFNWRRQTGAYHVIAINPNGHIMVQASRGPRASVDHFYGAGKFPDSELPNMKSLSDILWVAWQHVADKTYMDTFISLTITNAVTNSLIMRAMNSVGLPLAVQP